MKIACRIAGSGGAYVTLADETAATLGERISGFQPALSKSPMESPGFGAPGIAVFDVGNQRWRLPFIVDRIHASPDAAAQFLATHAAAIGGAGNMDLQITIGSTVVYMAACALTEFAPDPHSDKATKIRYGFAGGSLSLTPP